jgi:hypothetical protein
VDRAREPASLEHLLADHDLGPLRSRSDHYRDWVRLVDLPLGKVEAGHVEKHAAELERRRYSIHFHCWTGEEFGRQLGEILRGFDLPGEVVAQRDNHHEFLLAVRRT